MSKKIDLETESVHRALKEGLSADVKDRNNKSLTMASHVEIQLLTI